MAVAVGTVSSAGVGGATAATLQAPAEVEAPVSPEAATVEVDLATNDTALSSSGTQAAPQILAISEFKPVANIDEQLDKAIQLQLTNGLRLGETLIQQGWISERQLGRALKRVLKNAEFCTHAEFDITNPPQRQWKQYEAIINCAAYNDVNGAEDDRAAAWAVNAEAPARLARIAAEKAARKAEEAARGKRGT